MTPEDIKHIESQLREVKDRLGAIEEHLGELNGKVGVLREFKAKMEGVALGSRWTLTALALVTGIVGGGGMVLILRGP